MRLTNTYKVYCQRRKSHINFIVTEACVGVTSHDRAARNAYIKNPKNTLNICRTVQLSNTRLSLQSVFWMPHQRSYVSYLIARVQNVTFQRFYWIDHHAYTASMNVTRTLCSLPSKPTEITIKGFNIAINYETFINGCLYGLKWLTFVRNVYYRLTLWLNWRPTTQTWVRGSIFFVFRV